MQTESLRVREAEFDKLFSASFDEFQGFPWGPSEAYPTSRGNSEALETVPLPNALDKVLLDWYFLDRSSIIINLRQSNTCTSLQNFIAMQF